MDPWLEKPGLWSGFHTTLIVALRAELTMRLPKGFFAEVEQYIWLQADDDDQQLYIPDNYIATNAAAGTLHTKKKLSTASPTAHVLLPLAKANKSKRCIRVYDKENNKVITVIELLSPSDKNKSNEYHRYISKREEYMAAGINLVEIDLLRRGNRMPMGRDDVPDGDYYVFVSRAEDFPRADVWSFTVREPIPVVPVPLTPDREPIPLAIRAGLDRAYDDADYANRLDYGSPPQPKLRTSDALWANRLLKLPAK